MSRHEKKHVLSFQALTVLVIVLSALVVSCGEQDDDLVAQTFDISGRVSLLSNSSTAMENVNIDLTDMINDDVFHQSTASDGTYSFDEISSNRWYLIVPSKGGYTFSPEQIQIYTNVNLTDADFKGTPN